MMPAKIAVTSSEAGVEELVPAVWPGTGVGTSSSHVKRA